MDFWIRQLIYQTSYIRSNGLTIGLIIALLVFVPLLVYVGYIVYSTLSSGNIKRS